MNSRPCAAAPGRAGPLVPSPGDGRVSRAKGGLGVELLLLLPPPPAGLPLSMALSVLVACADAGSARALLSGATRAPTLSPSALLLLSGPGVAAWPSQGLEELAVRAAGGGASGEKEVHHESDEDALARWWRGPARDDALGVAHAGRSSLRSHDSGAALLLLLFFAVCGHDSIGAAAA